MRIANRINRTPRRAPTSEPTRTIRRPERPARRFTRGSTVISSAMNQPTMLLSKPKAGAGGVSIQPGTALKVVDYRDGWNKVETMSEDKTRGWVSSRVGPELEPQLSVPRCDRKYVTYQPVEGKIFVGNPKPEDLNQGWLGDCFLMGGLGALAWGNPESIRNAIREGDEEGTYIVTIDRVSDNGRNWGKREIKIDNVFPTKDGHLLYGQGGKKAKDRYEIEEFENGDRPLWPAIIEKAFATMLGGYDKLDQGGMEAVVFESLTGNDANEYDIGRDGTEDNKLAIDEFKRAIRKGLPVACSTKGHKVVTAPKVYDNHVYIAVGYSKDKVILRNPHDARDTMALSYKDFSRAFESFAVANV